MKILEYIKDIAGTNYVGVNIYNDLVYPYLDKLKTLEDNYEEYVKLQQDRDHGKYHCTVLNVLELNSIVRNISNVNILNQLIGSYQIDDFKVIGLGQVQKNENKAYFIICRSEKIQEFRKRFGLEEKDLHITIGFKWKDVHGVSKNTLLKEIDPFIKELGIMYYDFGESFNFLKEIENYDYDISHDVFPIKISDTYATFRVGNNKGVSEYFIISIIANKLTIAAKWQDNEEIPIISNTLIQRKLK